MQYTLDQQNSLVYDNLTGRLRYLKLGGHTVIKQTVPDLSSGNYLMYPWVNRIQTNLFNQTQIPYKDDNGLPLHGLYASAPRTVIHQKSQDGIVIKIVPQQFVAEVAQPFQQIYTLTKNKLRIDFKGPEQKERAYCFGYHPYLQIDQTPLKQLTIQTDIKHNIKLSQQLLPIFPYQICQITISSQNQYDHLFKGGSFLSLKDKKGLSVRIESPLPYWQIYTPPEGSRIAVQPMSFTGNIYHINENGLRPTQTSGWLEISINLQ